jgi:hypothetical protein
MVYQAISTAAIPITQPTTMPAIVIPGRVSEALLGIVGAGVLEDELTDDHLDEIVDELEAADVDELVASAAAESDVASKAHVVPAEENPLRNLASRSASKIGRWTYGTETGCTCALLKDATKDPTGGGA